MAIQQILHPERYHGHSKRPRRGRHPGPSFFEGWYYKLVDASERFRYAIIPGIFVSADRDQHHAFVQVLNGVTGQVTYHRYPPDAFWSARDAFEVRIGPNRFAGESIHLELSSPTQTLTGEVHFEGLTPWPVTLRSPGIMGWYSWLPFMECYHGVLSLDHSLRGAFVVDGEAIDWTGGRGYIEKDWGASFPAAWIWLQTNHFAQPGTSLTASVAVIPWLFSSFRGFIIGLWHQGKLYRWATYTGARIDRLEMTDERIMWAVSDRRYRLEMEAARASGGILLGPSRADMGVRVPETLQATVQVRLVRREGSQETTILEGSGRYAGLEVAGAIGRVLVSTK